MSSTDRAAKSGCRLVRRAAQLIVYHFMFAPGVGGWPTAGCPGCSLVVDHIGPLEHLHAGHPSLVLVSLAPLAALHPYNKRMGSDVPWVQKKATRFNKHIDLCTAAEPPYG